MTDHRQAGRRQGMGFAATILGLAALLAAPLMLSDFLLVNVLGRALIFGVIALSLTFLVRYGGFVSLAQMVVAGVAGYTIAVTVPEAIPANTLRMPYSLAVPLALIASTIFGAAIGAVAVRTTKNYLLMITLAISVGFFYFAQSNLEFLNGYEGIRNVLGPSIFGMPFRDGKVLYYSVLSVSCVLYGLVIYVERTPFGLVLQGIRDNARRVSALGYHVGAHRIAAFGLAGFIAGWGGILSAIYNIGMSPGQVSTHASLSILMMSVIGGVGHASGAFIGALLYTLLDTFAADLYDRERFNTLIGVVFVAIVMLSPDGFVGLSVKIRRQLGRLGQRVSGGRRAPAQTVAK